MRPEVILLRPDNAFANRIGEWAQVNAIETEVYDVRSEELADGMILINSNQDCEKDDDDLHALYYKKHIPTQRIDINGTLQVAVTNFQLWLNTNKCHRVLIVGSDELLTNENLERFLQKIKIV